MSNRSKVNDLLNRFAKQEREVSRQQFMAPSVGSGKILLRIGKVVCTLRVSPRRFRGWGVFESQELTTARLVGDASLSQRREYLSLFPRVRLIACLAQDSMRPEHSPVGNRIWYGCAAHQGDARIKVEGIAPITLAEEIQIFDTVCCRFDGQRFWFEERELRGDLAAADYLRREFAERTEPKDLARSGLTAAQRAAFELAFVQRETGDVLPARREKSKRSANVPMRFTVDRVRAQLADALSHAGGELLDYLERSDGYRVTYMIGNRSYTSSVNKHDLSLQVAGVCLSGEDANFDLGSLVGVLREGNRRGGLLRVGDHGMPEDDYWQVHPPVRR